MTFIGMALSVIVFFGLIVPIWHWMTKSWEDAERKGVNPYINSFYGLFLGYIVGLVMVSTFVSMVDATGFKARVYVCYYFGGDENICKNRYKADWEAMENMKASPTNTSIGQDPWKE